MIKCECGYEATDSDDLDTHIVIATSWGGAGSEERHHETHN